MTRNILKSLLVILVLASLYPLYRGFGATIQKRLSLPQSSLESGLIGYWSFNGPDLTDKVYDRSGQGNHGFFVGGATSSAKTAGKIGQALRFDDNDDYINIGTTPALQGLSTMTMSVWLYLNDGGFGNITDGEIIWRNAQFRMSLNGPEDLDFCLTNGSFVETCVNSDFTPLPSRWVHVVGTWDGTTMRLYYNGVAQATTASFSDTTSNGFNQTLIGSGDSGSPGGVIDELRIYNRALTQTEITHLYKLGQTTLQASQETFLDDGLVGYWPLNGEDISGVTAYDRSGSGNSGTISGSPATTIGKLGQGLQFDGSNDYVDNGDMPSLEGQSAITLVAWAKPTALGDWDPILSKFSGPSSDITLQSGGAGIGDNSAVIATIRNGSDSYGYTATGKFVVDEWVHLAMVFDGTQTGNSNRLKMYLNGAQEPLTFSGTIPATTVANTRNFRIGNAPTTAYTWTGPIDEVRAYNRALSASEIAALYNATKGSKQGVSTATSTLNTGLVGYWSFNGPDLTDKVYDRSGQGNHGFFVGGATSSAKTAGKIGQALTLDNVDDYISAGDGASIKNLSRMSVSAWVKPVGQDDGNGRGTVVNKRFAYNLLLGYYAPANTNRYGWVWCNSGSSCFSVSASSSPTYGEWQHVVGTYDGTTLRLYVNGTEEPGTPTGTGVGAAGFDNLTIGVDINGNDDYWPGGIDEVRMYNRALSAQEVKLLYSAGR